MALTAMALGVGLYLIPLGMIANPMIIELGDHPLQALTAFVKIAIGLSAVSYGLIAYRHWMPKLGFVTVGMAIAFL